MTSLPWRFLIAHALWITGAASLVAAFSYYDWLASVRGESRRAVMGRERGWRFSSAAASTLIASGFLLMHSTPWPANVGWAIVLLLAVSQVWRCWRGEAS